MKAISSMATRNLLADLMHAAGAAGLRPAEVESVGGVVAAQRVQSGERFDLVFLAEDAIRRLTEAGHLTPTSARIAVSQVAVAVPSDHARVAKYEGGAAFADAREVRDAIRAAARIGYSTGPSGVALLRMMEDWGLRGELDGRLVEARPGVPVAQLLAAGEVDLGFQQLSEMVDEVGVRILGVLPPDCSIDTVFAGAVAANSADAMDAKQLLEFIASPATVRIKSLHHFVPV